MSISIILSWTNVEKILRITIIRFGVLEYLNWRAETERTKLTGKNPLTLILLIKPNN
jgi:hypothetical protein